MTWWLLNKAGGPATLQAPDQVQAAILEQGCSVREADGVMYQAKRDAKHAAQLGNLPPVLRAGEREFFWRDERRHAVHS